MCAMRGWARKGPWGPEVDALAAACGWVRTKPLDRHGLSTPLELKLPQLHWEEISNGRRNDFVLARFGLGDCPPLAQLCWKHVQGP